jgi:cell division septum initiation protein DivIVA
VDENQLLDQLDLVRLNLPEAFHEAENIVRHKEEIFLHAEQYAQEVVEAADRQVAQILNESAIMRQAELEAQQLQQRVQEECDALRAQTLSEIEQLHRQAQQELESMQRTAIAECEEIHAGADEYADRVLRDMENQFSEMLRIIRNGRQQLQPSEGTQPRSLGNQLGRSQPAQNRSDRRN